MAEIERKQAPVTDELLRTKLAPPRLYAALVPRPALLARLEACWDRKLTLISAPAGSGKTTLVAGWVAAHHHPVAWVSLDAGDNDPVRFWRYIITACRTFDQEPGKAALASLRTSRQPSFEVVLTRFINELAQLPGQYTLVLEDYHAITSPQVHETVTFLLDHLPATLHLVLMTRREPPLPLARLRTRNELCELGASDLRFSREETQAFLQQALRLSLSEEGLARLEQRTEGWIAGLHLMALALQGRSEPQEVEEFLTTFTGEHRYILEYLADEVLATQPEPLQTFLLQTSFLNRLTGPLCDAVTSRNDSTFVLEQLERANLFLIPLSSTDGQQWYRYHLLFADAMRRYARQRLSQDSVLTLYEKASLWAETRGLLGEAVEAALAARQFGRAATLIEQLLESRDLNELYTLRRWVEQLPSDVLYRHPALCFNYAMVLLFTSDRYAPATAALLEPSLRAAEESWRLEKNDPRLGQLLSLRGVVAFWQGDFFRSFDYVRQSLELLAEHDVYWRGISLTQLGLEELLAGRINSASSVIIEARALSEAAQNIHTKLAATLLLAEISTWQGEFDQAGQYYQQVLAEAIGGEGMLDDQGQALLGLGAIALERNDLEAAEQHASRALKIGQQRSHEGLQLQATLTLARVRQVRGQTAQAQEQLQTLVTRLRHPSSVREIQAAQAWLALAVGDLAAVQQWQAAIAEQNDRVPLIQQEREALIFARLYLAQNDGQATLEQLAGWRADARAQGRLRSEIEILSLQALAHFAQGELAQAEQAMTRALIMAQPRGFCRIFLDEGEQMAALLQAVIPRLARRSLAAYAASLLRAFAPVPSTSPAAPAAPALLFEPLSLQEQRVLRLLVAGLSNPEIARELVVSRNTVKTHVKNIYRKLNVTKREEAGEAARELNLL